MGNLKLEPKSDKSSGYNSIGIPQSSGVVSWQLSVPSFAWRPPTDVYETEDRFVVRVEIAGMKESDFTVRLDRNHLLISGIRLDNPEPRSFHLMEINYGEFGSEVEFLVPIEANKVEAEYKDGFLSVILLKVPSKPITISA
jgi:HSP20 family protein